MGKTRNFNTSNRDDRYPDFSLKKAFKILLPEILNLSLLIFEFFDLRAIFSMDY